MTQEDIVQPTFKDSNYHLSLFSDDEIIALRRKIVVKEQITKIHKGDRKSAEPIIKTIESYSKNPFGKFDVKVLKGKYGDLKRLRAGNYRVIFDEEGRIMSIYEIRHRQEAYHD